jgi:hypothetical protein
VKGSGNFTSWFYVEGRVTSLIVVGPFKRRVGHFLQKLVQHGIKPIAKIVCQSSAWHIWI